MSNQHSSNAARIVAQFTGTNYTMAQPIQLRPIGAIEETSLMALLDYVADQHQTQADRIYKQFYERFNIGALNALPKAQFDAAVKYLVDQIPDDGALAALIEA